MREQPQPRIQLTIPLDLGVNILKDLRILGTMAPLSMRRLGNYLREHPQMQEVISREGLGGLR